MTMRALLWLVLLAMGVVQAGDAALAARDGWIRAAPPVAKVRAGYLVIENHGDAEVVLNAADSADFGAIEIHEMIDDAGTMRMRRVLELRVPANGRVELKPGGLHLMMFRPQRELPEGAEVKIALQGPKARVEARLLVRAP
ncbi:MAG: copper chaperone PCu(A)C [Xanthomonadales bacterium]|nr:copper chaperone PCu(A)C [Xanthomonadales bacterium]